LKPLQVVLVWSSSLLLPIVLHPCDNTAAAIAAISFACNHTAADSVAASCFDVVLSCAAAIVAA
jgi:hypothetical protein